MRVAAKLYDGLIHGSAVLAAFLLFAMMVTIFIDVILRNIGYQSSSHFFTFTEYGLLLVPCLGAPWLVRERGHVFVEIMLMYLSRRARDRAIWAIGVACVFVCLVIAWYGFQVTWSDFLRAARDSRSFDMPRWMLVGFIPLSFLLMATEFLRLMARGESVLPALASETPDKD